jgi:hypothetical protein
MKTTISFEFTSESEAAAFLSRQAPAVQTGPMTAVAPQAYAQQAPMQQAPQAYAQQAPAPAPVQQQAASNWSPATIIPFMQAYANMHKADGVKAVFAKYGAPANLTQLDAIQLANVGQHFQSMQPA